LVKILHNLEIFPKLILYTVVFIWDWLIYRFRMGTTAVFTLRFFVRLKFLLEKTKESKGQWTVLSRSGIGSMLKDSIVYVQILILFHHC